MNSVYIDSAVAASPIYIGPTNANAVNIGNATASTTINGPLVMGPGSNIGLQPNTGYLTPSAGMLGFQISNTAISSTALVNGGNSNKMTITSTASGVYIFNFTVRLTSAAGATINYFQSYLGGEYQGFQANSATQTVSTSLNPCLSGSAVRYFGNGTTLGMEINLGIVSGTVTLENSACQIRATRIA